MKMYESALVKLTHVVYQPTYAAAYTLDVQFFMKQPDVEPKYAAP